MNRRQFLSMAGAFAGSTGSAFAFTHPDASPSIRSLVIVDLDGGNDGLNTVIPIDDPLYRALRPGLAIPKDRALTLDQRTALHPSLLPLMSAWHARDMAIVQGVGHAAPDRSHYRSRQIWETASDAHEYRSDGWLSRVSNLPALNVVQTGPFVASCKAAARLITTRPATALQLTLHGFDTHENQALRHASLLAQFAEGLALLRADHAAVEVAGRMGDAAIETVAIAQEIGRLRGGLRIGMRDTQYCVERTGKKCLFKYALDAHGSALPRSLHVFPFVARQPDSLSLLAHVSSWLGRAA